jgi:hypothetical protein
VNMELSFSAISAERRKSEGRTVDGEQYTVILLYSVCSNIHGNLIGHSTNDENISRYTVTSRSEME